MKVLIGTTNPSKVKRFQEFLPDCQIEFYTLKDIGVASEPEERGNTPEENAMIKAQFYGQFFDRVICNDSGLYFDDLPLDDPRQPGLNIRTPHGGPRLNDEEMISYYCDLIQSLGGRVLAYYLDGIAVYNKGRIFTFMDDKEDARNGAFYMVDQPSVKRKDGWPLDSISVNRNTLTYFVDGNNQYDKVEENIIVGQYRARVVAFLKQSLGIE